MTDVDNPPITFTNARYIRSQHDSDQIDCIRANINGVEWSIPIAVGNTDYDDLMRQVEAGTVTIE